ncbi:MAG TPA: alanine racemase [Gemmatimonadaceae bacterium]|nr:alanine racemase [Gemmatimonadaceae bacterium]
MRSTLTRAWVEIDLGALRRNAAAMAARGGRLLPMIKADAYGLGAIRAARALETLDPWGYGVATVAEGAELRESGIERRILVATPLLADDLPEAKRWRLTPSLARPEEVALWKSLGGGAWHLSIDTGMSRAGIRWDEVDSLREALEGFPPEGAFTHFHSAAWDPASVDEQRQRFEGAVARLPARPRLLHAENSAALERVSTTKWDLVRPGVFLYGVGSGEGSPVESEPVAHVRARIVDLRSALPGETVSYDATYSVPGPAARRIATLSIGYADGYRRSLSNCGVVIIRGALAPVAGCVTMDMTMVDVTEVECEIGDVATLIGRDGAQLVDLVSVGERSGLSPYELLTGLRGRLDRVYLEEA